MPWQFTTPGELEQVRAAGRLAWDVLQRVAERVRPGVTTLELSELAESLIVDAGATPTTKGFRFEGDHGPPFPHAASICVNDEVMFGIPDGRVLRQGDVVTIDLTLRTTLGWHADVATSVAVAGGERAQYIAAGAQAALDAVLAHAKPGAWWQDVMGHAAEAVGLLGLYLLPGTCGHGIGRAIHEDPWLSYPKGRNVRLAPGMVLCLEPVVLEQPAEVLTNAQGVATAMGGVWSAFEERMVAITPAGSELLSRSG
ncbi:MAG TPA: M24 family metallopeptidase [Phycisphaerales bacterium]|nr:M24 family metallopeptidase [Phycisphaerales bacterium]